MRINYTIVTFLILACIFIISTTLISDHPPLIPRTILFGNPQKAMVRISPDGKYITYLAPTENHILNIWIKSVNKDDDTPLTYNTHQSISAYVWAPNSNQVLYLQDTNGDENWKLYGITISNKLTRCYTPFKKTQTRLIALNKHHPNTILIALNKDHPQAHDAYSLNLLTGELALLAKNPGTISEWLADRNLTIRAATEQTQDGGSKLLIRNQDKLQWQTIITWDSENNRESGPIGFSADGNTLYLTDSRNTNTSKLAAFDIKNQSLTTLAHDDCYDIDEVYINPTTYDIDAVSFTRDYKEWQALNTSFESVFKALSKIDTGNLYILSCDDKQENWVVCFEKDNKPYAYYLFNASTHKSSFLFTNRPELQNYTLAPMKPFQFISRDGLTIHGYLTHPPYKQKKNLPLILVVHGGPWSRDAWGYDAEAQWLANRGYLVMQINYRGSTGYGKAFVHAGDKEWGGKMHNDLIDGIEWALNKYSIDRKKIAIYGASYGGYAALVGATFTPDVFCCAIDVVGISNLLTFLNSIPPYWKMYLTRLYQSVGHPVTEKEFLKSRSPLFKIDAIKIPILIAQGANDPRVNKAESEQIVNALKKRTIDYEYLLFSDEGHGFSKEENKLIFYAKAEKFLARYLNGRYEI